jgi:periplasmic divalent cation tolerance protein
MCLILSNCPRNHGAQIARQLVKDNLAACVNVVPGIRSFYRWENQLVEEDEETLIIKCSEDSWPLLRDRLDTIHPYDVPEIIKCAVEDVNVSYLEWILNNSKAI